MNTESIAMTTRDQIALDIYIRSLFIATGQSREECTEVAYQAADVFLAKMAKQTPPADGELDDDHPLWGINAQITGLLEGYGANEDHEMVIHFLRQTGLPKSTVGRIHKAICCAEVAKQTPPAEERKTVPPEVGKRYYLRNGECVKVEPTPRKHTGTPFRALSSGGIAYHYYLPDGRHESKPQYDLVSEVPA